MRSPKSISEHRVLYSSSQTTLSFPSESNSTGRSLDTLLPLLHARANKSQTNFLFFFFQFTACSFDHHRSGVFLRREVKSLHQFCLKVKASINTLPSPNHLLLPHKSLKAPPANVFFSCCIISCCCFCCSSSLR